MTWLYLDVWPLKDESLILKDMKKNSIKTNVFLITSFISIKAAVAAMKLGAFADISRPFDFNDFVVDVQQSFSAALRSGKETTRIQAKIEKVKNLDSVVPIVKNRQRA